MGTSEAPTHYAKGDPVRVQLVPRGRWLDATIHSGPETATAPVRRARARVLDVKLAQVPRTGWYCVKVCHPFGYAEPNLHSYQAVPDGQIKPDTRDRTKPAKPKRRK